MTSENATAFIEKVSQDGALFQQVMQAITSHGTATDLSHLSEQQDEAVAHVAQQHGCNATASEIKDAFGRYRQQHPELTRELSETELDLVAGGGSQPTNTADVTGSAKS